MNFVLAPSFLKDLRRLSKAAQDQFKERRDIFLKNPADSRLRNHALHGEYAGCRSINITGDIRAIFTMHDATCIFLRIGTHSELYE